MKIMYRQGVKKRFSAFLIFVFLLVLQLWPVAPNTSIENYLIDKWDIIDGVPPEIISITQTPDGYLYIATNKELFRFDGIRFEIVPFYEDIKIIPKKSVYPNALFLDKSKILWIASAYGLTSYDYRTGKFKTLTTEDGLPSDKIRKVQEDMSGNLWIGFFVSFAARYSNGKVTTFGPSSGLEGKKINAIIEDRYGHLILGTREDGLFIYKDGQFSHYIIEGLNYSELNAIREDSLGALWIGTKSGLSRFMDGKLQEYTSHDGLSGNAIFYIFEDSDQNLWVGSSNGLNRVKVLENGSIHVEHLLPGETILYIFEDSEKNLWIGTAQHGLKRLKDRKFFSVPFFSSQIGEEFTSLYEDANGDIYAGSVSGKIFRYNPLKGQTAIIHPMEMKNASIISFARDSENSLWIGTIGNGVFKLKNKTWTSYTTGNGLADNTVTSIFNDSKGSLWFSTLDGVSVLKKGENVIQTFGTKEGLPGKCVSSVIEDKSKNIWIATDKGIIVLKDGMLDKSQAIYYLKGTVVSCIYEDSDSSGVFWISTNGDGLKRLDKTSGRILSFNTSLGMATDFLYRFYEDHQGYFWIASNNGVLRLDKNPLNQMAYRGLQWINCISYDVSDGLKDIEFNNYNSSNSAIEMSNGEFWFVTKKGISTMNPGNILINKIPPQVIIEKVNVGNKSFSPIALMKHLESKGNNEIGFRFSAPTFLSPSKVKYKYFLKGYEADWKFLPQGSDRFISYKNLNPGEYTFKVTACNSDGIWNREGDSVVLVVEPFFYQTLLFKIFILFVIFSVTASLVYFHFRRREIRKARESIEKKEEEKLDEIPENKRIPLPEDVVESLTRKLKQVMETEKNYRDQEISLKSVADQIGTTPHVLSQLLNENLNRNFADFINSYRIEEIKAILDEPEGQKKKNWILAHDAGFNNMTVFYKAFKKYTGMTTNDYRKKIKK